MFFSAVLLKGSFTSGHLDSQKQAHISSHLQFLFPEILTLKRSGCYPNTLGCLKRDFVHSQRTVKNKTKCNLFYSNIWLRVPSPYPAKSEVVFLGDMSKKCQECMLSVCSQDLTSLQIHLSSLQPLQEI